MHTIPKRNSIFTTRGVVRHHERYAGDQHVLTLEAPTIAAHARPGSFVHVDCGPQWLLRRPMSIMAAERHSGRIEMLFKCVGHGTSYLAGLRPGDEVSLIGPIGNAFTPTPGHPQQLLLGGGVGIPPVVFMAEQQVAAGETPPWLIAGSELPFPFATRPATLALPGAPDDASAALSRLEASGIPNRLASLADLPGTFRGYVTELAEALIGSLSASDRDKLALYACGPMPMLAAVAALARRHRLPCQVSLEEYMACGVGGCAGCTVEIATASGPAMQRVCVDGPVFDATAVFPEQPLPKPTETPLD